MHKADHNIYNIGKCYLYLIFVLKIVHNKKIHTHVKKINKMNELVLY